MSNQFILQKFGTLAERCSIDMAFFIYLIIVVCPLRKVWAYETLLNDRRNSQSVQLQ
mgnify:CR=1 FL=1